MKRALILAALAIGCTPVPTRKAARPATSLPTEDEGGHLAHLYGELQDDILTSYERDEPPDLDTALIERKVGTARIGAGPLDVFLSGDAARPANRWPLDPSFATRTEVRSKSLAIQIAIDQNAAWMSDELSWRLEVCGRTAVIPLRMTALYAHDGDRWVSIFEHTSFGWPVSPAEAPAPRSIKSVFATVDLKDELSGVLGRGLFRTPHDASVIAQDPLAIVLGPDAGDEWHGPHVLDAKLPGGRLEDRRIGVVGRDVTGNVTGNVAGSTVAYWIGSYLAEVPSQNGAPPAKVRMRVTHVFEKRHTRSSFDDTCGQLPSESKDHYNKRVADCRWLLVQSHVSQPITAAQLTRAVFGSARPTQRPIALPWLNRLLFGAPKTSTQLDCSDGTPATTGAFGAVDITPGAGRRPAGRGLASPAARQSP